MCGKINEEYENESENVGADVADENVSDNGGGESTPERYTNKDATRDGLAFATRILDVAFGAENPEDLASKIQEAVSDQDYRALALNVQRIDALMESLSHMQALLSTVGLKKMIESGDMEKAKLDLRDILGSIEPSQPIVDPRQKLVA